MGGFRASLKLLSDMYGIEHLVDVLLRQSDVASGSFQIGMAEYLVEQDQRFRRASHYLVDIAPEGLAEGMCGKSVYGNPISDPERLKQPVDVFQRVWVAGPRVHENQVFHIGAVLQLVQMPCLLLYIPAELHHAVLAGFLLRLYQPVAVEHVFPSECTYVRSPECRTE